MAVNWDNAVDDSRKKAEETKKQAIEAEAKAKQPEIEAQDKLIYAARDVLGAFLSDSFAAQCTPNPTIRSFMKNFAPYTLRFTFANGQYEKYFSPQFANCPKEILPKLISGIVPSFGEVILTKKSPDQDEIKYLELFPEYHTVKKVIMEQRLKTISPLAVVMMMEPEKRPLIAVASKKFMDSIKGLKNPTEISAIMPDLETVLNTAKEFNCTDGASIRDAISEFNTYAQQVM